MRKDMKDVIVNTGRQGGGWGKKLYNRAYLRDHDPDDLPIRLPIARRRQYSDPKSLGDRIAPLRAFLDKQVGRPWADVWHEVCENADARTIRGFHLRQHVWIEVARNKWGYGGLFIDDDGTLQRAKELTRAEQRRRWHKFKPTEKLQYKDEPDRYYEKIEGIWYSFVTTHTTHTDSRLDLKMVDGEVELVRIPLPDVTHHETVKRQVDGDMAAKLDADADEIDAKWLEAAA